MMHYIEIIQEWKKPILGRLDYPFNKQLIETAILLARKDGYGKIKSILLSHEVDSDILGGYHCICEIIPSLYIAYNSVRDMYVGEDKDRCFILLFEKGYYIGIYTED